MEQGPGATRGSQPTQRCCLGLLYYSQALQDEHKKPVCMGLKHTPGQQIEVDDRTQLQEGITDYKFFCLGHSVYRLPQGAKGPAEPESTSTSTDATTSSSSSSSSAMLPYCEGFEVIVAGKLEDAPALHHSTAAQHSERGTAPGPQQQQQPSGVVGAVLGGGDEGKVAKYLDRFVKVAHRNIDRMQSTLNTAYNLTVKPFIDRLSDDS